MNSLAAPARVRVRDRLILAGSPVDSATVADAVRQEGHILDQRELARLVEELTHDLHGAGALEPYLADPQVTDILVNGHDALWVDRGQGLVRVPNPMPDEAAVRALAVRLAARSGRRLDDSNPCVDARLPGGQRLHAIIPPIAPMGTAISLRLPPRRRFTLADLVALGTVDAAGARLLAAVIASRVAFLVSGGTGSGKTTVLGALLGLVGPAERIVIVEDTTELRPAHAHVVHLESRPANVEGAGAVGLQFLVRQALRMRPDRLVVGEVRGAEIVDLLAALNTGHEGGCGTLHANSAVDVPARVCALALAAGMSQAGVHAQLASGLDMVLHVSRSRTGDRRVQEVAVLQRQSSGEAIVVPALLARDSGGFGPGPGYEALRERLAGWWSP